MKPSPEKHRVVLSLPVPGRDAVFDRRTQRWLARGNWPDLWLGATIIFMYEGEGLAYAGMSPPTMMGTMLNIAAGTLNGWLQSALGL